MQAEGLFFISLLIQSPHPISTTYLDQQVARASSALPAAGAYDASPLALSCPSFLHAAIAFTYTRGGVGGKFEFKIEVATAQAPTVWHQFSLYDPGTVAGGSDTLSLQQRESVEYASTSASAERFAYQFNLNGLWEKIRVTARETGTILTPGTLKVDLSLS